MKILTTRHLPAAWLHSSRAAMIPSTHPTPADSLKQPRGTQVDFPTLSARHATSASHQEKATQLDEAFTQAPGSPLDTCPELRHPFQIRSLFLLQGPDPAVPYLVLDRHRSRGSKRESCPNKDFIG
ncbi:abhydrolase domain-containing protein 15 [Platysternon megacephalum]|uniref:Abhydrolase domain-containing protein 15 n=1 Tax=Platysternon megacephalum TaxID=55544 RepID=A0A4D9DX65_9SAUR|nr:abhydrolase domain-containing protein 15 [Platysternon megacephalum]